MPRCSAISRPTATRCMSRRPVRPAASCSPRSTPIRTSLRRTDLNRPGLPNGVRLWVLGSSDERVPYFPSAARALAAAARDRVAGRRSRTDGRSQTGSGFGVWGHAVNPSRVFPQPRASAFHAKFRPAAAHPDVHASNRPVLTNAPRSIATVSQANVLRNLSQDGRRGFGCRNRAGAHVGRRPHASLSSLPQRKQLRAGAEKEISLLDRDAGAVARGIAFVFEIRGVEQLEFAAAGLLSFFRQRPRSAGCGVRGRRDQPNRSRSRFRRPSPARYVRRVLAPRSRPWSLGVWRGGRKYPPPWLGCGRCCRTITATPPRKW